MRIPRPIISAALLALAPAVREGLVADDVIVDAKSGISGAGRGGNAIVLLEEPETEMQVAEALSEAGAISIISTDLRKAS